MKIFIFEDGFSGDEVPVIIIAAETEESAHEILCKAKPHTYRSFDLGLVIEKPSQEGILYHNYML